MNAFTPRKEKYKRKCLPIQQKDYVGMEIYDKVIKTGEGENDFVVIKDCKINLMPIDEVIAADAESVGVYNIIKQVTRTGDTSLLPKDNGACNVDLVDAPSNMMELKELGKKASVNFGKLPDDLKKGRDMKAFVQSLTQEEFDSFVKAVADRSSRKVENKDE